MVRGQCGDYARHFISFVPKHVVDMATQIVKIQSPKLDSAISLKVCNLGLFNLVID